MFLQLGYLLPANWASLFLEVGWSWYIPPPIPKCNTFSSFKPTKSDQSINPASRCIRIKCFFNLWPSLNHQFEVTQPFSPRMFWFSYFKHLKMIKWVILKNLECRCDCCCLDVWKMAMAEGFQIDGWMVENPIEKNGWFLGVPPFLHPPFLLRCFNC